MHSGRHRTTPVVTLAKLAALAAAAAAVTGASAQNQSIGIAGLPAGFNVSTTSSTHYVTLYLLHNTNAPYHKLDPPFVSVNGVGIDEEGTVIAVSLGVNRVYAIEPKSSSFILDMDVVLSWEDRRLAFWNPSFVSAPLEVDPNLVWKPFIYFSKLAIDTASVPDPIFESVVVTGNGLGTVSWARQMVLPFSSKYALQSFPYDNQTLSISLILGKGDSNRIYLDVYDFAFAADVFSSLWTLDTAQNETRSSAEVAFTFSITRVPASYVSRYILPMAMLCIISCITYFIEPSVFPPRFTGLVALMLSVVTMNVIVSQELPKVKYLTTLDIFITCTFLYVFMSLIMSAATYVLHLLKFKLSSAALQAFLRVAVPLSIPFTFGLVFTTRNAGFSVGAGLCVAGLVVVIPVGCAFACWEVWRMRREAGGDSKS
ncbi:hypothetical protein DFJ73DRAFT_838760 [Zopfochytrium polystomum]|nr:hypothetical protein DFJ73DRAFT_838760 [Zopfochytrium polystomum]